MELGRRILVSWPSNRLREPIKIIYKHTPITISWVRKAKPGPWITDSTQPRIELSLPKTTKNFSVGCLYCLGTSTTEQNQTHHCLCTKEWFTGKGMRNWHDSAWGMSLLPRTRWMTTRRHLVSRYFECPKSQNDSRPLIALTLFLGFCKIWSSRVMGTLGTLPRIARDTVNVNTSQLPTQLWFPVVIDKLLPLLPPPHFPISKWSPRGVIAGYKHVTARWVGCVGHVNCLWRGDMNLAMSGLNKAQCENGPSNIGLDVHCT